MGKKKVEIDHIDGNYKKPLTKEEEKALQDRYDDLLKTIKIKGKDNDKKD